MTPEQIRPEAKRRLETQEVWKPVVGYEGYYDVSDQGRVRSMPRPKTRGGILAQKIGKRGGYPVVSLVKLGRQRTVAVHKLLTETFLGSRPAGAEVRHLDGNPLNCKLINLAYGSKSENMWDSVNHGTHKNASKTHCPQGHEYAAENVIRIPSRPNARYCRECRCQRS